LKILSSALSFKVRRSKEIEKEEKVPKIIGDRKKKNHQNQMKRRRKQKQDQIY